MKGYLQENIENFIEGTSKQLENAEGDTWSFLYMTMEACEMLLINMETKDYTETDVMLMDKIQSQYVAFLDKHPELLEGKPKDYYEVNADMAKGLRELNSDIQSKH